MPLSCAQCGRDTPADAVELAGWRNGDLVVATDSDDTTASMLLCPDCDAEGQIGDYDPGGED